MHSNSKGYRATSFKPFGQTSLFSSFLHIEMPVELRLFYSARLPGTSQARSNTTYGTAGPQMAPTGCANELKCRPKDAARLPAGSPRNLCGSHKLLAFQK